MYQKASIPHTIRVKSAGFFVVFQSIANSRNRSNSPNCKILPSHQSRAGLLSDHPVIIVCSSTCLNDLVQKMAVNCVLFIKAIAKYLFQISQTRGKRNKGSRRFKKVQFFLTLFKRPLTPPPFYLNICPILQGVFFERVFEHLI